MVFQWVNLPSAEVVLGGEMWRIVPVAISLYQVSIGQFAEFTQQTGYQSDADQREGDGYLLTQMRLNWGKSPKLPAFGLTYNDARAFCDWAHLRLPSEPELHHFFATLAREGFEFEWAGECWTTTPGPNGTFVVRNGPYRATVDLPLAAFRAHYEPDHYDYPFMCFRVARTLEDTA